MLNGGNYFLRCTLCILKLIGGHIALFDNLILPLIQFDDIFIATLEAVGKTTTMNLMKLSVGLLTVEVTSMMAMHLLRLCNITDLICLLPSPFKL